MGEPSDDDVPTVTSSADLRRDDDGSGADADDQTIQKAPDAVGAIEGGGARGPSSAPRPAAGLPAVPADKLPPPPAHPLRPRMPSSPNAAGVEPPSSPTGQITPAMRARAPSSSNALARAEPVKNEHAKSDSKSDVRTVQSSRDEGDAEAPPTLESEPPPSEPATSPKSPAMIAPSQAPRTPKMPNAPPVPKVASAPSTAKRPLAPSPVKAPAVPPSVRSPMVPTSAKAPTTKKSPSQPEADGDGDGDSITATAPRVPASMIPLSAPKQVEIRTLDDDDSGDETEVKTLSADLGEIVRSSGAGTSEADAADDSVTAQAPVPPSAGPAAAGAKAKDNDSTAAVIRIGGKSLMPKTSASPSAGGAYDPDEEDSVTARTLALDGAEYPDDSVTTQSPSVSGLPEAIDGETEGTTKRVRKKPKADPNASEADAPDDSVTAAAPGHLTNMLRVIASPSDAEDDAEDDDEMQAHTQVMLNAPVKPPEHSRRSGAPDAPSSESGLRVTGHDHRIAERASLGALGVPQNHSGAMRGAMASDPALGPSPSDGISRVPFGPMSVPQDDKKPPYALVVGIVAAISILIPVMLFIILSQGSADADADAPRVTSQPSPDPVGFNGPRPKAGKPAPSTAPSVRPTTTGGGPTNRGPFRR